jgi:phosphoglucosamine mutase
VVEIEREAAEALKGRGRVFLRHSGTEPLTRILVEGPDPVENERWAGRIADIVREHPRLQNR